MKVTISNNSEIGSVSLTNNNKVGVSLGQVGVQGPNGVGAQGVAGSGNQGATGTQGPFGVQGAIGVQGTTGVQGTSYNTTISTTPPVSANPGDMWWDSETGIRYVYYNDGTSSQWVQESYPAGGGGIANPYDQTFSFSNTTTSISNTTGALTVSGGLGVGGNTNIAGNVSIARPDSTQRPYVLDVNGPVLFRSTGNPTNNYQTWEYNINDFFTPGGSTAGIRSASGKYYGVPFSSGSYLQVGYNGVTVAAAGVNNGSQSGIRVNTFNVSPSIADAYSSKIADGAANVTSTANTTLSGYYATLGDYSANTVKNTLYGVYVDVGSGNNTTSIRNAGVFLGGNVGISTNTPSANLHVIGTSRFESGTTAGASAGQIAIKTTDGANSYVGIHGGSWNALGLWNPGANLGNNPGLSVGATQITLSLPFGHYSSSITFNPRGDIGANPGVLINSGGTGVKTLAVKAFASQTANLTEWQNSTGTILTSVGANGDFITDGNITANGKLTFASRGSNQSLYFDRISSNYWTFNSTNAIGEIFNINGNLLTIPQDVQIGRGGLTVQPTLTTAIGGLNTNAVTISPTWNNSSAVFTATKINVTDTASTANSSLIDLQVGGTSYFSVLKTGRLALLGQTFQEIQTANNLRFLFAGSVIPRVTIGAGTVVVNNAGSYGWRSVDDVSTGVTDVLLFRDAANTLALRNGTANQAFRIYNTYTDASNYERATIGWSGNILQIGTANAGTGLARSLELQTNGTTRLTISSDASGVTSATGVDFISGGGLQLAGTYQIRASSRARLSFPADGVITLNDWAATSFSRLQFGGTTSAFPSLKRNGTFIQARLADDSGDAGFSAANVGIGISAPTANLHVIGTANVTSNIAGVPALVIDGPAYNGLGVVNSSSTGKKLLTLSVGSPGNFDDFGLIRFDSNNKISFASSGTVIYDSNLSVGRYLIGSSAAGNVLDFGASATNSIDIRSASGGASLRTLNNTYPISFATNSIERIRITPEGNVGIGTTSPLARLETSSDGGRLRITQNTNGNIFNGIEFTGYTGGVVGGLLFNQATGEIRLNAPATYFPTFYSSGNEVARFNTNGNFGIGTTTPTANLHVIGTANVSGNLIVTGISAIAMPNRPAFRVYGSGTTNNLTTTENGNGILTANNFTVDYQQGTSLNTASGIFTAPVDGIYQVNVVCRNSGYTSGISQLAVVKNYATTSVVQVMVEFAANSSMNHTGGSTASRLAAGDTLVLKVLAGQINYDANDNWSVTYLG